MLDLLLTNAWVCRGAGQRPERLDIGIRETQFVELSPRISTPAAQTIDASDRVIIPGIIDVHTHYDQCFQWSGLTAHCLRQGVTSVIGGNCGMGEPDVATHLKNVAAQRIGVRYGVLVAHGPVRDGVVPRQLNRAANDSERPILADRISQALDAGAIGWSFGPYDSNLLADTQELLAAARAVAALGRLIVAHRRCEGPDVLNATREFLAIGLESGANAHISHLKVAGKQNWQAFEEMMTLVEKGRQNGQVSFDLYPYDGSLTYLSALIPGRYKADGRLRERLQSSSMRDEILQGMTEWFENRQGPENIVCFGPFQEDEAQTLGELADALNLSPQAAALQWIEKDPQTYGGWAAYKEMMAPGQVECLLNDSEAIIASDAVPEFGVIAEETHPRAYSTFARMLNRGWQSRSTESAEESAERLANSIYGTVAQMTSKPARRFGLKGVGEIKVGSYADLVVLDPQSFAELASYESPAQYPCGIERVFVGGHEAYTNTGSAVEDLNTQPKVNAARQLETI